MNKNAIFMIIGFLLLSLSMANAQYEELTDEELEAIAQQDMLEYMVMHAPVRFDKDLQVGDKLVYQSKYGEKEINTIKAVKDTLNAFWVKEEFEGNIIYQLISRETGELLDIKGYDEEGRFNHPQMLSDSEKQEIVQKRIEKKDLLQSLDLYSISNERKDFVLKNKNYSCKLISNSVSSEGTIHVSEEIPRMLPFSFSMELEMSLNVLFEERSGLVDSGTIKIIDIIMEGSDED
jgi:hypothetical protein